MGVHVAASAFEICPFNEKPTCKILHFKYGVTVVCNKA